MSNDIDSIVVFGQTSVEEKNSSVAPVHLISGEPRHTVANYYDDSSKQYRAGIWQSTAGKWHAFSGRRENQAFLELKALLEPFDSGDCAHHAEVAAG